MSNVSCGIEEVGAISLAPGQRGLGVVERHLLFGATASSVFDQEAARVSFGVEHGFYLNGHVTRIYF